MKQENVSSETNTREKIYDWFPISREPHWIIINVEIYFHHLITSSLLLTVTMLVYISHFSKCSTKFTIIFRQWCSSCCWHDNCWCWCWCWCCCCGPATETTASWKCWAEMTSQYLEHGITKPNIAPCLHQPLDIALQLSSPVPAVSRHTDPGRVRDDAQWDQLWLWGTITWRWWICWHATWHYSVLAMINSSHDMQSLNNSWVTWYMG